MRRAWVFGVVVALLAATAPAAAQTDAETAVVPPPPPASPPPPGAVTYAPAPAPMPPPPPSRRSMSPAAPFMLGFGLTVLGGFTFGALTALLANADLGTIDGEGGTAIGVTYGVSLILMGVGAYLAIGSLVGEVEITTDDPGWIWFAAITSMAGGVTTLAAGITYFVDDDFGDDSLGLGVAALTLYALCLTALFGLDGDGSSSIALAPAPLEGGGGVIAAGQF